MSAWLLRRAGVDDLDAIMSIELAVFGDDAWSRQNMRAELEQQHGYYLVAMRPDGSGIDGYAGLFAPEGAPAADIHTIAVAPGARRQGLGRVLMQQLIRQARRRGAREILLEVRADNPAAQSLYRVLGFEPLSVRKAYYRGGVDAVVMRLIIPPSVMVPA